MKKAYTEPVIEVIEFETEDIMNASGVTYDGNLTSWSDLWNSVEGW